MSLRRRSGYCPACSTEQPLRIESVDQTFCIHGEEVTVRGRVAFCCRCGEDVFDRELDFAALESAYAEYRRTRGIPSPQDIVAMRQKYGLGQRPLAKLLGWSPATVYRYEKGSVPAPAHAEILKRLADPSEMADRLRSEGHRLSPRERARAEEEVMASHGRETGSVARVALEKAMGGCLPGVENGFQRFRFEKLLNMMVFFAGTRGMAKTALMKLLWYADFQNFRVHAVSISGARYAALPYGPAPDKHFLCLEAATETGAISIYPETFGQHEGERILGEERVPDGVFSDPEWGTLRQVAERLGRLPSVTLTALSHREDAWNHTRTGEIISYLHALTLREPAGLGPVSTPESGPNRA
ncbi:MAG: DUF4065 domain-containing protein [bacterium]|nr:DUF4065 domain-containing protein [bacterium]